MYMYKEEILKMCTFGVSFYLRIPGDFVCLCPLSHLKAFKALKFVNFSFFFFFFK